jgi:hypothetical protein
MQWELGEGVFGFTGSIVACCGCLTQVRGGESNSATPALTEVIRSDRRIPDDPVDIREQHLPIFAAWQRCIDALGVRDPTILYERFMLIDHYIRSAVGIHRTRRHFEGTP